MNYAVYDEPTDGPISIERVKRHVGCLAVDCGWRADEVKQFVDQQGTEIAELCKAVRVLAEVAEALRQFTIADSDDVSMAKYKRLGARVKRAWRAAAKNPIAAQSLKEAKA